jgi:transcriptional regulator with XRE-family HTH domain
MSKKHPKKISDQIRIAIDDSGLSRYRIAKDTELDQSALGKFYNGERGLSMESLDRIGVYLGLRIEVDRKNSKKEN